jgi:acetyl esterase/lipase
MILISIHFVIIGGGFRIGRCDMFMDTWIQWIKVLKESYGMEAMMMSVDYRLAPEYKYPSPVEDIVRAYESLTKTLYVDAEKVIVTGDSAGAALILEMLFITHDPSMFEIVTDEKNGSVDSSGPTLSELPRPAGAVFSSPLVTDETTSESWKLNVKYDYISQYTAKVIKKDYFEPLGPDSPPDANQILGIAKLETGFRAFLPEHVLMFVGNKEVLRDDALDLAMKAENDGCQWETVVEDCVHDWFCVREVVKDKEMLMRADATFADFCYRAVRHIRRKSGSAPVTVRAGINGSQVKVLYENGRVSSSSSTSDYSSMRRSSEGLEMVLEEDEEEYYDVHQPFSDDTDGDDDFSDTDQESTVYTANFGKKNFSPNNTATAIIVAQKSSTPTKQKPKTIFV